MIDNIFFKVNECVFPYLKNKEFFNERSVEIPLGEFFINNFGFGVTEVGNSLDQFNLKCGTILSIQEALDYNFQDKNVVSIGVANYNIEILKKIISSSKHFLSTHAIGFDSNVDSFVKNNNLPRFILKRISENNLWEKCDISNFNFKYNSPYAYGNAICCITNLEILL